MDWQDFPAVTPPKNVPLWLTVRDGQGYTCADAEFDGEVLAQPFSNATVQSIVMEARRLLGE